jgi:RHS repeat-associated protein
MLSRSSNSSEYRYGYQGSESDDEIKGDGNSYATHFRLLDPRIGRWLSIDPKSSGFESPYASMGNNPIMYNDALGDTVNVFSGALNSDGGKWQAGQDRLFLFSLDDGSESVNDITFNSNEYKELDPQWEAENIDNYLPMLDLNTSAFLDYGAGALLTPSQLKGFLSTSQLKLHSSSSYKLFGWGNLSKYNNFDHGKQGDIKSDGSLLDGTFLTLYNPFGAKPTIVRTDNIGNFVYGAMSEAHGQTFIESRSDGDFLQSGGKDDMLDTYFLYLGHQAVKARIIPSTFNKSAVLPKN